MGSKLGREENHWLSWEKISQSKENGGLGFREMYFFNLAMVAKQYWRLLNNEDSTAATILKERYFPRGCLDNAKLGYQPSYLWRSILNARELVREGTAWRVGDGTSINCFEDRWVGTKMLGKPRRRDGSGEAFDSANTLFTEGYRGWNREWVLEMFDREDALQILNIPLSHRRISYKRIWNPSKNGNFTVKSACYLAIGRLSKCGRDLPSSSTPTSFWKQI